MRTSSRLQPLFVSRHRIVHHGIRALAVVALLAMTTACDNFDDLVTPEDPAVTFSATLEPLAAEVHIVTIPTAGVITVSLDLLEAQQVDDSFDDATLGLTIRLARVDNNCDDGAAFGLTEGQRVVFDLAETSYCLNVSEPGLIPEGGLAAYTLGVTLP